MAHMDWHFRVLQKTTEAEKRGTHRSWYVDHMVSLIISQTENQLKYQTNILDRTGCHPGKPLIRITSLHRTTAPGKCRTLTRDLYIFPCQTQQVESTQCAQSAKKSSRTSGSTLRRNGSGLMLFSSATGHITPHATQRQLGTETARQYFHDEHQIRCSARGRPNLAFHHPRYAL